MLLLVSCFVTHKRNMGYDRYNRLDVFKYMLQSYSRIPFTHAFFYIKLDDEFNAYQNEIEQFIKDLFITKVSELSIEFKRLEERHEFGNCITNLISRFGENELVWFTQNDDHIFIDTDADIILEGIELLKNDNTLYKTLYYSHWPELIRVSGKCGHVERIGNYVKFRSTLVDNTQVFTLQYLKYIVLENNWNVNYTKRIDNILPYKFSRDEPQIIYVPLKEICRKMNGYSHVNMNAIACPPLVLPPEANIFPIDSESIKRKIVAEHQSPWTIGNHFIIPDEWIETSIMLHQKNKTT